MVTPIKEGERLATPYAPYRSWKNLLEKLKGKMPLPPVFDSSFWSTLQLSGGLISVLKPTMVCLALLDKEMRPLPLLEEFLTADDTKRKELFGTMLGNGFPNYAQRLDTARMTAGQLTTYLGDLGATGNTGDKSRSFFIGLVKDSGKPLSRLITTRTRTVSTQRGSRQGRRGGGGNGADEHPEPKPPPPPHLPDAAPAQSSLMLWGLFKRLPEPGQVFLSPDRDTWIETAKAIFNLEYRQESESDKT